MKSNNKIKSTIFSFIQLKKKYVKVLANLILTLKNFKKFFYQSLHFFLFNNYCLGEYKKKFLVSYVISFCFSIANTMFHISDANGNLKTSYSAGLVDLQGKQKIARQLVLKRFFNILFSAKLKFLKKNPVAIHFKNVNSSNKFLIVKNLKKKFFIKIIKTFELSSYNGCRQKKLRRKR